MKSGGQPSLFGNPERSHLQNVFFPFFHSMHTNVPKSKNIGFSFAATPQRFILQAAAFFLSTCQVLAITAGGQAVWTTDGAGMTGAGERVAVS